VKSNDDNLYAATVRQTPRSWCGWKLLALGRKEDPRRRQSLKRLAPRRNPWALQGPDELR
jgi:hypothetical protein